MVTIKIADMVGNIFKTFFESVLSRCLSLEVVPLTEELWSDESSA